MMEAFGQTDRGKVRKDNQDSILLNRELQLFMVADGMGGHAYGDVASELAVQRVNNHLSGLLCNAPDEFDESDANITAQMKESFYQAHQAIDEYSQNLPTPQIMGSTLSILLFRNKKIYLGHIGDSRIYRLRGGQVEKLTKDHTEVQGLVDIGLITEEDAENHPLSHVLTRVLGVDDKGNPDIHMLDVAAGDRYLISSDGLFRDMSLAAVSEVLAGDLPVREKCRTLMEQALDKGARDNVSMIILEV